MYSVSYCLDWYMTNIVWIHGLLAHSIGLLSQICWLHYELAHNCIRPQPVHVEFLSKLLALHVPEVTLRSM